MLSQPGPESNRLRKQLTATIGALALTAVIASVLAVTLTGNAFASSTQAAMFQDDMALLANPMGTLQTLRRLGVDQIKLAMRWQTIAPKPNAKRRPKGFKPSNPEAYPARNWAPWDAIITDAQQLGISVLLDVAGGAPRWATGPGDPNKKTHANWEPSAREYGAFLTAVGTRYSGHYTPHAGSSPLPRVSLWSIWNEPNYGPSLAPQGVPKKPTIENSPRLYRNLLDSAWSALHRTGHGNDKILFGEVAPRGVRTWGIFSGMKPLIFLRALYCVNSHYRQLRGSAATARGCPRGGGFRSAHPALFGVSGFADHPYMRWYPPNREIGRDPDFTSLAELKGTERALDRLQHVYGSGKRLVIYDTEFGYITSPPQPRKPFPWVSQPTAAYYLNWAEYISWRDPRVQTTMQFLLRDPLPKSTNSGGFATGLLNYSGTPKPTYAAYRLPVYLPVTNTHSGQSLEVWGCVRPADYATLDSGGHPQIAHIQFAPGSSGTFTTVQAVTITDPQSYFDTRVVFPGSGRVRVTWSYPDGTEISSREVNITVH